MKREIDNFSSFYFTFLIKKMALIKEFKLTNKNINISSEVVADYSFDQNFFEIRTYKKGDIERKESTKQNIQLNKQKAK
ncbi:hypothetical protein [Caminibacter profundus]